MNPHIRWFEVSGNPVMDPNTISPLKPDYEGWKEVETNVWLHLPEEAALLRRVVRPLQVRELL
jgi:hypothetical protein